MICDIFAKRAKSNLEGRSLSTFYKMRWNLARCILEWSYFQNHQNRQETQNYIFKIQVHRLNIDKNQEIDEISEIDQIVETDKYN